MKLTKEQLEAVFTRHLIPGSGLHIITVGSTVVRETEEELTLVVMGANEEFYLRFSKEEVTKCP